MKTTKKNRPALSLDRETLRTLHAHDIATVNGGDGGGGEQAPPPPPCNPTVRAYGCCV